MLASPEGQQTGVPLDTRSKLPYGLVAPNTKPISDEDELRCVTLIFMRTRMRRKGMANSRGHARSPRSKAEWEWVHVLRGGREDGEAISVANREIASPLRGLQ